MTESPNAVRIRVRDNGPLVVDGAMIQVVDGEGTPILPPPSGKTNIALCRCGKSGVKPFCDGAHREVDFRSTVRAASPTGDESA